MRQASTRDGIWETRFAPLYNSLRDVKTQSKNLGINGVGIVHWYTEKEKYVSYVKQQKEIEKLTEKEIEDSEIEIKDPLQHVYSRHIWHNSDFQTQHFSKLASLVDLPGNGKYSSRKYHSYNMMKQPDHPTFNHQMLSAIEQIKRDLEAEKNKDTCSQEQYDENIAPLITQLEEHCSGQDMDYIFIFEVDGNLVVKHSFDTFDENGNDVLIFMKEITDL
eukprot:TRINITY_DN545_c0_g1_i1.p1 TRINITY_DN545_c0_g1~~TRINITY_DN545_c0_g1_i1.p1  ORF type:complete len:247 (-),score=73.78 TRINITY_DN545_c0_g1_i1:66-722(-)